MTAGCVNQELDNRGHRIVQRCHSPYCSPARNGKNRQLRMKRILHLSLSLLIAWPLVPAHAGQSGTTETTYVYKPDGTRHCNNAPGISLDSMAQELVGSGIVVVSQRKSYDGREGVALCGDPTGSINAYEIGKSKLSKALELGFKRLDKASSGSR